MKRSIDSASAGDNLKMKKIKSEHDTDATESDKSELVTKNRKTFHILLIKFYIIKYMTFGILG